MTPLIRSSRSLLFALSLSLPGLVLPGVQDAGAQDLPDLEEIDDVIEEAQSIVARSGVCVAIADEAGREAMLARLAALETETHRDQAGVDRIVAEAAADAAEAAADAAEVAARAAEAAEAAERRLRNAEIAAAQVQVGGDGPGEGQGQSGVAQRLEDLRRALRDAREAAAQAATAAEEAAEAARRAISDAMLAASTAEDAAVESEAAGEAAMRAMRAAARAQSAADAAGDTADRTRAAEVEAAAAAAAAAAAEALSSQATAKAAADSAAGSAQSAGQFARDAAAAAATAREQAGNVEQCAEEVSERESTLATARAASTYLSRTVVDRIQKLRPVGQTSFGNLALPSDGMTGVNAGDEVASDYPPNLALDISYSRSRRGGLFDARSQYVLIVTDRLLTAQRLLGFGAGAEYTREALYGGVQRRTRGITATVYLAQILTESVTFVPQAALTYLDKESESSATSADNRALRGLGSLTVLGQTQRGSVELSGFGQFAYTYEEPMGSSDGEAAYLGQAIAGGEAALEVRADARVFVGASLGYDLLRSESTDSRLSYGGNVGLRSRLSPTTEFSLSVTANRQDEEETFGGNMFVKVFF